MSLYSPSFKKIQLMKMLNKFQKEEASQIKKLKGTKNNVTLKQKLIILHELGIFKLIDLPNTKLAELLSVLLGASAENIRKNLSSINDYKSNNPDVKTENNLKFVIELFGDLGLQENAKKLESELQQVKKE